MATTVKEIRRALIDADVNFKVAKEVTDSIKEKALGQDVLIAVSPGQLLTKIVSEELTELMGGSSEEINLKGDPNVILISGLQGSVKPLFQVTGSSPQSSKQKRLACSLRHLPSCSDRSIESTWRANRGGRIC